MKPILLTENMSTVGLTPEEKAKINKKLKDYYKKMRLNAEIVFQKAQEFITK